MKMANNIVQGTLILDILKTVSMRLVKHAVNIFQGQELQLKKH